MAIDLNAPIHVRDFIMIASQGWAWWKAELIASVPARLRRWLSAPDARVVLTRSEMGWIAAGSGTELPTELDPASPDWSVDLVRLQSSGAEMRLSDGEVLVRHIDMPTATRAQLCAAVALQLERLCPLPPDRVVWDVAEYDPSSGMRSACGFVEKGRLAEASQLAQQLGLGRYRVTDSQARFTFAEVDTTRRLRLILVAGLWAFALILAVLAIGISLSARQHGNDSLESEIVILRPQAEAASILKRKIEVSAALVQQLSDLTRRTDPVALWAEIARALPKSSWLTSIETDGTTVTLQGFSKDPAAALESLSKSELLKSPSFDGALQRRDDQGADQFVIRASVKDAS